MLVSHKNKFITIGIPKTGTRSLRVTLNSVKAVDIVGHSENEYFKPHDTALVCEKNLEKLGYCFADYFSFCVVRNPWSRYLSFFKYFKERAEEYKKTKDYTGWHTAKKHQGEYCAKLFENANEQHVLRQIITTNAAQSHYYLGTENTITVSYIASFEKLPEDFDYFCSKVGIPKTVLLHENKSTTKINFADVYNQELVDLVAKKEEHTIDLKGYSY